MGEGVEGRVLRIHTSIHIYPPGGFWGGDPWGGEGSPVCRLCLLCGGSSCAMSSPSKRREMDVMKL